MLLIQRLQLAQHLAVARMALTHHLQGFQGGRRLAAAYLQLSMGQGNRQFRLRLTAQGLLQQTVAFLVAAQLLGGASGTEVMHQGLGITFGGAAQMPQRALPTAFGQVQQALFGRQLHPSRTVASRPGIDHPPRRREQAKQQAQTEQQQPQAGQQYQGAPQTRLVTEAFVSHQHVTRLFNLHQGIAARRQSQQRQQGQQQNALHGCGSSTMASGNASVGAGPASRSCT